MSRFLLLFEVKNLDFSIFRVEHIPANTQDGDNVVVRSQRCTINTQRCSDVDATALKLQHWMVSLTYGVILMLY